MLTVKEQALTVADVAKQLNISLRSVYNLMNAGKLGRIQLSTRLTRFKQEDVDSLITSCRLPSTKQTNAGVTHLTASYVGVNSELLDSFRKAGVDPKRIDTILKSQAGSTRRQVVSVGQSR